MSSARLRGFAFVVLGLVTALEACGDSGDASSDDVELPPRADAGEDAPEDSGSPADEGPSDTGTDAPAEAGCDGGPACARVVFVTSASYVGNAIGGIAGADAKCQARALASTLAGIEAKRFRAWISTQQSAVKTRLVNATAPYRKPTGAIIATSWADLTDGSLASGIDQDENGVVVGGLAWTGTTSAGDLGPDECDAWTASGNNGRAGNVGGAGAGWSSVSTDGCGQTHRLYCFEE